MSTFSEPAESPAEPAEPAESIETTADWLGPVRRAARAAWRHKVLSGVSAAFVVAIIVVSALTTGSPSASSAASVSNPSGIGWIPVTGSPAAASFTLPVLGDSARQLSLAQYTGKPVVVNFFASWCSPCQQETPLLASWYKRQGGKMALLGLDENDSTASAEKFVAAKGVSYPVGFDPNTIAANGYGIEELPQTFFLNAQHHIVGHWAGAMTTAVLAKGLSLMNTAS
jgi:cytochrome c biogenesis protein CcmG/thiol:disulfide interchange protein DsbE